MPMGNGPRKFGVSLERLLRDDEYALARLWFLVLAVTIFFGIREAWGVDTPEFDVSKSTTSGENSGYGSNIDEGTRLYMKSGQTAVDSSWSNEAVVITQGGSLMVGNNKAQDAAKLNLTLKSVTFTNDGSTTAPILQILNSKDPANGTVLNLETLNINAGGTVDISQGVGNAEAGWNKLIVETLNANGAESGSITVKGNGLFSVTQSSSYAVIGGTAANINSIVAGKAVDLHLGSGGMTANASFAGGLIIANGKIVAKEGQGNLAVGSGATGLKVYQGGIEASSERTLNILAELGKTELGNVNLGGGAAPVSVTVNNGSTINMGALTTQGTVQVSGTDGSNKLNATKLAVRGTLNDAAKVATSVTGLTTVSGSRAVYVTAGTNNVYAGGINVSNGGVLTSASGGSTITVGGQGVINVANGSIAGGVNAGSSAFVVRATEVNITDANAAALDGRTGVINLSSATVNVAAGGAVGILPDYNITVGGYNQTSGAVTVGREAAGRTGRFVVAGRANIGGGSYNVTDNATNFRGGATVSGGGVIASAGAGAGEKSVTVGYAGTSNRPGDLVLAGKGTLSGRNGALMLYDATGAAGVNNKALSAVRVEGSGNRVIGDVNTTKMDVIVSGANAQVGSALRVEQGTTGFSVNSLTVNGGDVTLGGASSYGRLNSSGAVRINANGALSSEGSGGIVRNIGAAGNRLSVARGGSLITRTASMTTTGFSAVDIGGEFVAGWDGTKKEIARLVSDSSINITSTGSVGLMGEAARYATVGATLMAIVDTAPATAIITSHGTLGDMSMFGNFGYEIADDRRFLKVKSVSGQIQGDYTQSDIDLAIANLRDIWGANQIGRDLGEIIYNASVNNPPHTGPYGIVAEPSNSTRGKKNIAIFQALASPTGKVVGRDTVEFVNGAYNYGVADVAISTATMFLQDINRRAKIANGQIIAQAETASEDALANQILEQSRFSRAWIGGFGTKNNVDGHMGFSGYEYDSTGFVAGYDTAVTPNIVAGGAFAYAKGDYKDKGARSHDSTIESYSGALYGTLTLPMGLYGTLAGGYTYSANDIRELRRDPSVNNYSWSEAKYGGHTWLAGGNVGWDFRFSQCFTLTPSVGLNYIHNRGQNHYGWLSGLGTQRERDIKMEALFMPVDLSARYDMFWGIKCGLRLEGNVGYTRNFKTDGIDGSVAYQGVVINNGVNAGAPVSSTMRSQKQDEDTYRFGAGVRYLYHKFDIGVKYDYLTSKNRDSHWVAATAGVKF